MKIKKAEIASDLLKTFRLLEKDNALIERKNSYLASKRRKENALAMCEIANTLNQIKS